MATLGSAAQGQSAAAGSAECPNYKCSETSGGTTGSPRTPSTAPKTPSASDIANAKFKALHDNLRANQQLIQNTGDALLGVLQSGSDTNQQSDNSDDVDNFGGSAWDSLGRLDGGVWENLNRNTENTAPAVDNAALAAKAEARRRAQINADAARIFQDSQSALAGVNGSSAGHARPNASSEVNSLLGSSAASNASNSAINNLLGASTGSSGVLNQLPQGCLRVSVKLFYDSQPDSGMYYGLNNCGVKLNADIAMASGYVGATSLSPGDGTFLGASANMGAYKVWYCPFPYWPSDPNNHPENGPAYSANSVVCRDPSHPEQFYGNAAGSAK